MNNFYTRLGNDNTERLTKAKELLNCTDSELPFLMGQLEVESQSFTRLRENLNYSSLSRINAVFPRVRGEATGAHIMNPSALGSLLYGDVCYSGYGGIQLTWKEIHDKFFKWDNRPFKDYGEPNTDKGLRDFWRTSAYYFGLMRPKLAELPLATMSVNAIATHYGRLINRGLNSSKRVIALENAERVKATKFWIKVCANASEK